MKEEDYTGKKYGRLTILKFVDNENNKRTFALCRCECGTEKVLLLNALKKGNTQSCGCLRIETSRENSTTHGMSKTRIYDIWTNMITRCCNENDPYYYRYGGRGIIVCDEWKNDFMSFYNWALSNGYNDRLTIDRINNDDGYSSENCRWATKTMQSRNRNKQSNNTTGTPGVYWVKSINKWRVKIFLDGKSKTVGEYKEKKEAIEARKNAERNIGDI